MVERGLADVVVDLLEIILFVVVETFGDNGIFMDCGEGKSGEEVEVGVGYVLGLLFCQTQQFLTQ